jgi:hypothetical protein
MKYSLKFLWITIKSHPTLLLKSSTSSKCSKMNLRSKLWTPKCLNQWSKSNKTFQQPSTSPEPISRINFFRILSKSRSKQIFKKRLSKVRLMKHLLINLWFRRGLIWSKIIFKKRSTHLIRQAIWIFITCWMKIKKTCLNINKSPQKWNLKKTFLTKLL